MEKWKQLRVSQNNSDLSPLLVKYESLPTEYSIHVTDLTNVWIERLDRRSIIRRAFDEDTSIDPSDGPEQYKKLLDHIESGVFGKRGTSTEVQVASGDQTLTIRLTAELPSPLKPLTWPFNLAKADSSVFTRELVLPLLHSLYLERSAVSSLSSTIKEKDTVICKLYDKLEVTGVDVGSIFPGSAPKGSKFLARDTLQRSIPGLQPFNEPSWRQSINTSVIPLPKEELCQAVFGVEANSASGAFRVPVEKQAPMPNEKVTTSDSVVLDSQPRATANDIKAENGPDIAIHSTSDRTSGRNVSATDRAGSASSTESEGATNRIDPGPTLGAEKEKSASPQVTPVKKRLGTLGGKSKVPSPGPVNRTAQMEEPGDGNAESLAHNNPITPPPKPRGRLGRIGGKQQSTNTLQTHEAQSSFEGELPSRGIQESADSIADSDRIRQTIPSVHASNSPRETSRERADRKRAELKREIEERKKAPPKKKRKF